MTDAATSALVTGGSGLIGRHAVAALLERRWTVTVLGRGTRPAWLDARAAWRSGDLLAPDAAPRLFAEGAPHVLVHLAWTTEHGRFWTAPENLDWVGASLRLLQSFAAGGGRRVVAAGTCVEYDAPLAGPCRADETPLAPVHLYAVAKDAWRRLLATYCAQHGMGYAWGRVFLVTGEGEADARFVPAVIAALRRNQPARCTSGRQVRDLMDARDCGAAFAALAAAGQSGAFNVCSGVPVALGDVARRIGQLMQKPDLVHLGALPDRPGEPSNLWGETRGLADIGFVPRYTLDETLRDAIAGWGNGSTVAGNDHGTTT